MVPLGRETANQEMDARERMNKTANKTLDRMTRSAVSRMFQVGRSWRAPRHRSALRWAE